jgi:hypothetical protein
LGDKNKTNKMETNERTELKKVLIRVGYMGYIYQEIEIPVDMEINDDTVDTILNQFDASQATDINDSIEFKIRYADEIAILDDCFDTIMEIQTY